MYKHIHDSGFSEFNVQLLDPINLVWDHLFYVEQMILFVFDMRAILFVVFLWFRAMNRHSRAVVGMSPGTTVGCRQVPLWHAYIGKSFRVDDFEGELDGCNIREALLNYCRFSLPCSIFFTTRPHTSKTVILLFSFGPGLQFCPLLHSLVHKIKYIMCIKAENNHYDHSRRTEIVGI